MTRRRGARYWRRRLDLPEHKLPRRATLRHIGLAVVKELASCEEAAAEARGELQRRVAELEGVIAAMMARAEADGRADFRRIAELEYAVAAIYGAMTTGRNYAGRARTVRQLCVQAFGGGGKVKERWTEIASQAPAVRSRRPSA